MNEQSVVYDVLVIFSLQFFYFYIPEPNISPMILQSDLSFSKSSISWHILELCAGD